MTQKDLPRGVTSGLDIATRILNDIEDIEIIKLTNLDVVRHPLVQKIVKAYDVYENKHQKDSYKNHRN